MELLHILRAEEIRDDHPRAGGKAVEEEHHHVDNHGGGTHRRQRLGSHKIAHHDGVHGVVEHLEHIAQHQGQGKQNNLLDDGAVRHVPDCGFFPRNQYFRHLRMSLFVNSLSSLSDQS